MVGARDLARTSCPRRFALISLRSITSKRSRRFSDSTHPCACRGERIGRGERIWLAHPCARSCGPSSRREAAQICSRQICELPGRFHHPIIFSHKKIPPNFWRKEDIFLWLKMVGARGFEPPTTTPPVWCATRLRYAPTGHIINEGGNDTCRPGLRKVKISAAESSELVQVLCATA